LHTTADKCVIISINFQLIKDKSAECWWLTPVILATWGAEIRIISFGMAWENSSRDPNLHKIIRAKETGGVVQMVEFLLCKRKVPNSNHSLTKGKNKDKLGK
jgi:hypothetical protein